MTGRSSSPADDQTLSSLDGGAPDQAGNGPGDASAGPLRIDLLGATPLDAGGADPLRKPRLPAQGAILVLLFIVAGALLFVMRQFGMGPTGASAQTPTIDYPVEAAGPGGAPASKTIDHQRILDDLSAGTTAVQVPPDQVQKNPFKLAEALAPAERELTPDDPNDPAPRDDAEARARRAAEERAARIQGALAAVQINSILNGPVPVARLDGRTVRVGDALGDFFTVSAIHDRAVELTADGRVYILDMAEQRSRAHGAGKASPGKRK